MSEAPARGPSSAEIKLNDIKVPKEKRREQALNFIGKLIDEWDFKPDELYDPEYICTRARELENR
jgi:precorrin-4 methylase